MEVDLFSGAEAFGGGESRAAGRSGKRGSVYTVSELTRVVLKLLEGGVGEVWVEGELSNCKQQASGHQYFTLKDAGSQLSCVWFAGYGRKNQVLRDGMQVRLQGRMTVYEPRGQYQLKVQQVEAAGTGDLLARFEALKRKLEAEGLFAPERRRVLPKYPGCVALITSPTGAVVRDMLNILGRRAPWVRVLISPVRVQGLGAAREIQGALEELNAARENGLPEPEVVVLARGGGSIEDLWEFNDEKLARAIAASRLPVVSAVGHEVDFTIADFVADLRAPTPSAAAELLVPDTEGVLRDLGVRQGRLDRSIRQQLTAWKGRLDYLGAAGLFGEPRRRLQQGMQELDWAAEALRAAVRSAVLAVRQRVELLEATVLRHRPDRELAVRHQTVETIRQRMERSIRGELGLLKGALERQEVQFGKTVQPGLAACRQRLAEVSGKLRLLDPQRVLERGYSITTDGEGRVLRSAGEVRPGEKIQTRLGDGTLDSVVSA